MSRRRWARVAAPFAAAAATVVTIALVAGAHDTDVTDPNDTKGKLDVRRVRLDHDTKTPRWTVVTASRWTNREMWDRGFIEVLLDTRRDEAAEYYLLVRTNRSRLEGSLWRLQRVGPDSYLGTLRVSRPSRRSATVEVQLWRLEFGDKRDFYRWWVHTVITSSVCPRTCHDVAPNGDPVLQWRPGRSPTPSVTTTPSATPTP